MPLESLDTAVRHCERVETTGDDPAGQCWRSQGRDVVRTHAPGLDHPRSNRDFLRLVMEDAVSAVGLSEVPSRPKGALPPLRAVYQARIGPHGT